VIFDRGNPDFNIEFRQHNTGAAFWDAVLASVCCGPLGSSEFACQVREWTLYDPGLALAVADIRARKSCKLPVFGYAGVTWQDFIHHHGGLHIVDNVKEALLAHLVHGVSQGAYPLPGLTPVLEVPESRGGSGAAPAPPSGFQHCCPRDSDLPLKQELYDFWSSSALKDQWAALVKEHDDKLNKSGVPHKARRAPETNTADLPGADAVAIPPQDGLPSTVLALKEVQHRQPHPHKPTPPSSCQIN